MKKKATVKQKALILVVATTFLLFLYFSISPSSPSAPIVLLPVTSTPSPTCQPLFPQPLSATSIPFDTCKTSLINYKNFPRIPTPDINTALRKSIANTLFGIDLTQNPSLPTPNLYNISSLDLDNFSFKYKDPSCGCEKKKPLSKKISEQKSLFDALEKAQNKAKQDIYSRVIDFLQHNDNSINDDLCSSTISNTNVPMEQRYQMILFKAGSSETSELYKDQFFQYTTTKSRFNPSYCHDFKRISESYSNFRNFATSHITSGGSIATWQLAAVVVIPTVPWSCHVYKNLTKTLPNGKGQASFWFKVGNEVETNGFLSEAVLINGVAQEAYISTFFTTIPGINVIEGVILLNNDPIWDENGQPNPIPDKSPRHKLVSNSPLSFSSLVTDVSLNSKELELLLPKPQSLPICHPAIVGSLPGRWLSCESDDVQREFPDYNGCVKDGIEDNSTPLDCRGPMKWTPYYCQTFHFTQTTANQCLKERGISNIITGFESHMRYRLFQILKLLTGFEHSDVEANFTRVVQAPFKGAHDAFVTTLDQPTARNFKIFVPDVNKNYSNISGSNCSGTNCANNAQKDYFPKSLYPYALNFFWDIHVPQNGNEYCDMREKNGDIYLFTTGSWYVQHRLDPKHTFNQMLELGRRISGLKNDSSWYFINSDSTTTPPATATPPHILPIKNHIRCDEPLKRFLFIPSPPFTLLYPMHINSSYRTSKRIRVVQKLQFDALALIVPGLKAVDIFALVTSRLDCEKRGHFLEPFENAIVDIVFNHYCEDYVPV